MTLTGLIWAGLTLSLADVLLPRACDVCGAGLDAPVVRASLESYTCHTCGQDCGRGDRLLAHSSRHTKIKTFFCDACPRNFSRASRLTDHKVSAVACSVVRSLC